MLRFYVGFCVLLFYAIFVFGENRIELIFAIGANEFVQKKHWNASVCRCRNCHKSHDLHVGLITNDCCHFTSAEAFHVAN